MQFLFPQKTIIATLNYSPLQCRLFQECSFIFAPVPLLPRCPVSYLEVSASPSGLCESRRPAPCFPQPVLPSAAVTALQYQVCVGPGYCGASLIHSFSPFIVPHQPRGQCLSPCTHRITSKNLRKIKQHKEILNLRPKWMLCRPMDKWSVNYKSLANENESNDKMYLLKTTLRS